MSNEDADCGWHELDEDMVLADRERERRRAEEEAAEAAEAPSKTAQRSAPGDPEYHH